MPITRRLRRRRGPAPIGCPDVVELITDYLDGALDAETEARVEAHLADCVDCHRYVEQIRAAAGAVGRLDEPVLSDTAVARLQAAFRDWSTGA